MEDQAGSSLEALSQQAGFHSAERVCAHCQRRKVTIGFTELGGGGCKVSGNCQRVLNVQLLNTSPKSDT